jgi:hypothetical protein
VLGEPDAYRGHVAVLQQENRPCHRRRVRTEAARKIEVVELVAAQMALRLRNPPDDGRGNNWAAAAIAKRLGKLLFERPLTRMAKRDTITGIEDLAANPTWRGKNERGEGFAHTTEVSPHRLSDPSHDGRSLRRLRLTGKRKMTQLARFVPTANGWLGCDSIQATAEQFRGSGSEEPLLVFFRAGNAVAGPRHGFQALLLKFLFALSARAVLILFDSPERFVD